MNSPLGYQYNLNHLDQLDQSSLRDELVLLADLRLRDPDNLKLRHLHRQQRRRYHTTKNAHETIRN